MKWRVKFTLWDRIFVGYISVREHTTEKPIINVQIFPILRSHIRDEEIGKVLVEFGDYGLFGVCVTRKQP